MELARPVYSDAEISSFLGCDTVFFFIMFLNSLASSRSKQA